MIIIICLILYIMISCVLYAIDDYDLEYDIDSEDIAYYIFWLPILIITILLLPFVLVIHITHKILYYKEYGKIKNK